jgi:hypothetical protein
MLKAFTSGFDPKQTFKWIAFPYRSLVYEFTLFWTKEMPMITAIVQFKVPASATREQVFENMQKAAPRFQGMPGLIRKAFLFDKARGIGGGVYTWESREAAEEVYAEGGPWRASIRTLYGVDPEIAIYETPVIVDNTVNEIQTAA